MAIPTNRPFSHLRKVSAQVYSLSVFIRAIDQPAISFNGTNVVEINYSTTGNPSPTNWELLQINIIKPNDQDYVQLIDYNSSGSILYFHKLYYEDADTIATGHLNAPHLRNLSELVSTNPMKYQYFPEAILPLVGTKDPAAQKQSGYPTDTLVMEVTLEPDITILDPVYEHLEFEPYTDLNPDTGFFRVTTVLNNTTKGDGKGKNKGSDGS